MPAVFEHWLTVDRNDVDVLGHVNNVSYVRWMQDAAVAHSAAQGWPTQRYLEIGAGWVARSHWVEYRRPAFCDERIAVLTWVSNFRKVRSLRKYKITRPGDDAVLAVAETDWTFIGFEHQVPRRVPHDIVTSFELVAEADEP